MGDYEGTMYRFRENDPLDVSIHDTVQYRTVYTLYCIHTVLKYKKDGNSLILYSTVLHLCCTVVPMYYIYKKNSKCYI
jgi:hypothetical protein